MWFKAKCMYSEKDKGVFSHHYERDYSFSVFSERKFNSKLVSSVWETNEYEFFPMEASYGTEEYEKEKIMKKEKPLYIVWCGPFILSVDKDVFQKIIEEQKKSGLNIN